MRKLDNRGDTIVEVLLSTAVIVAILGASYALSNRSLQTGRAAQERAEALKVAETQVERLKAESGEQDFKSLYRPAPPSAGNYCIYNNAGTLTKATNTNPGAGNFSANCRLGTGGRYRVNIAYTAIDPGPAHYFGKFDVQVFWDRIATGTPERLIINYQL